MSFKNFNMLKTNFICWVSPERDASDLKNVKAIKSLPLVAGIFFKADIKEVRPCRVKAISAVRYLRCKHKSYLGKRNIHSLCIALYSPRTARCNNINKKRAYLGIGHWPPVLPSRENAASILWNRSSKAVMASWLVIWLELVTNVLACSCCCCCFCSSCSNENCNKISKQTRANSSRSLGPVSLSTNPDKKIKSAHVTVSKTVDRSILGGTRWIDPLFSNPIIFEMKWDG